MFPIIVIESTLSLLPLSRYLLPITTLNRHTSPEIVVKISYCLTLSKNITVTRNGVFFVTIPILWLCHNLLNSVNSVKVILEKLNCEVNCNYLNLNMLEDRRNYKVFKKIKSLPAALIQKHFHHIPFKLIFFSQDSFNSQWR